jgi:hypothetical protein
MAKAIRNVFKIETFSLVECNDGYYLWDGVVEMNISMRAKTEQDACIKGLLYYQKRLSVLKADYKDLSSKVETFVAQFVEKQDDEN